MIKFGRITSPVGNIINEINKTKKMNFDYVELCIEPLTDYIYLNKNKKTIKKLLKNFFHKPIAHTAWWYDLSSPYELIRKAWIKQAERDIKIASKIGAKSLNFHFMVHSKILLEYNKPRQIILSNYVKSLRYISDFAQRYKVMIMLENVEEKFDYYKYILDRTPKLNVHLDVGHAFISGGMKTIRKFISYFDGRIAHIHVHDNHGNQDEHLALREGKINWKHVVFLLKKSEYEKTMTFEVFKSEKDLVKSREYFKKLWNK